MKRVSRCCFKCGVPGECRQHLPDGRDVDDVREAHGGAMTLAEVGAVLGYSRARIGQIEARALMKCAAIAHRLGFEWHAHAAEPGSAHAKLAHAAVAMREADAELNRRSLEAYRRRKKRAA